MDKLLQSAAYLDELYKLFQYIDQVSCRQNQIEQQASQFQISEAPARDQVDEIAKGYLEHE